MDQLEAKFLQYLRSISAEMTGSNSVLTAMVNALKKEMETLSLNAEARVQMLSQLYAQEAQYINSEATKAALALIQEDRNQELTDAQLLTEQRKRQGYDDNVLIEIMKAQGSLASFAVNANSDTAQDTIDDLHAIMDKIEDRACDIVCDTPVFDMSYDTDTATPVDFNVFGNANMTYTIVEHPASGTLTIGSDGNGTYTPDTAGSYNAIITTEDTNGLSVMTRLIFNVSQA
jgi:hypothetical protein